MTPSILLIEDDLDFANLVGLSLGEEGFEVVLAPSGEVGLKLAAEATFDLILLDLMLPGVSGLEVCRSLRQAENHTPLLMLTARDSELDRVLGLEMGADDYMPKTMGVRELVANALRHTPAGGKVQVRVLAHESSLEVRVIDNGEGIAPEELPRIFERFYRVAKNRDVGKGSTGLGLAIVRQILALDRSEVQVSSKLQVGTVFRFRLAVTEM
jgi:CheY-like chemotaxis protein